MNNYSMYIKKFLPIGIILLLIIIAGLVMMTKGKTYAPTNQQTNTKECTVDADCACGVDKITRQCAIGNSNTIDTIEQCPDFCSGIEGNLTIKCKSNKCVQTSQNNGN